MCAFSAGMRRFVLERFLALWEAVCLARPGTATRGKTRAPPPILPSPARVGRSPETAWRRAGVPTVHQDQVVALAPERFDGFDSVGDDVGPVAELGARRPRGRPSAAGSTRTRSGGPLARRDAATDPLTVPWLMRPRPRRRCPRPRGCSLSPWEGRPGAGPYYRSADARSGRRRRSTGPGRGGAWRAAGQRPGPGLSRARRGVRGVLALVAVFARHLCSSRGWTGVAAAPSRTALRRPRVRV